MAEAPAVSAIDALGLTWLAPTGEVGFRIIGSRGEGERATLVSPELATCTDCFQEIFDSENRGYGYPFANCIHCGPRFTIVKGISYDRPRTTMAGFSMCRACAAE